MCVDFRFLFAHEMNKNAAHVYWLCYCNDYVIPNFFYGLLTDSPCHFTAFNQSFIFDRSIDTNINDGFGLIRTYLHKNTKVDHEILHELRMYHRKIL